MGTGMTTEEKKHLNAERSKAVREAWKHEKELVSKGQGTRDWTKPQQTQLMQEGRVKGYEGHHMKSVSTFPQHAGEPKNIQMLSESEHFAAHQGNYHTPTNGYYNPETKQTEGFRQNELRPVQASALKQPAYKTQSKNEQTGKGKPFDFKQDRAQRQQSAQSASQKSGEDRAKALRAPKVDPASQRSTAKKASAQTPDASKYKASAKSPSKSPAPSKGGQER